MTDTEKRLMDQIAQLRKENKAVRAGAQEINRAVDAILIATALAYGAELPDGGRVLTMARPAVALAADYRVRVKGGRRGKLRVVVRKREKGQLEKKIRDAIKKL